MKVDFYKNNEQLAPIVENYLFSQDCSLIMNGQYIEQDGQWYQITGQTIPVIKINTEAPDEFLPLPAPDVFVYPVTNRPVPVKK